MTVRWGILSASAIGRVVVPAAAGAPDAEIVAVAARDGVRAKAYAAELGIPLSFGSYDELLDSDEIDAVYVPLPISMHTDWTVRALEAGKHVLCEKPFAMTAADAARCFEAAERAGKVCIEGLMYRHHPQTSLARRLVAEGAIGRLAEIRAVLSVSVEPDDIRRTPALGGGAVYDLGCYCVSAIRLFGGEPSQVYAVQAQDGPDGEDLRTAAVLTLPDGVLGHFDVGLDLPRRDELEIIGTGGKITIPDPWLCRPGHIELERDGVTERLPVDPTGEWGLVGTAADSYRIELGVAAAVIAGAEREFGREDAIAQARVLESLRRSAKTGRPVPTARVMEP
ncbi:Gfo/Idh/MocA family protein [Pseudonocardia sp. T1-2H]|uniref:Gfo/Idh/MocA family protein n=1 Tax=Pseudonocardia sp. T1-2H TaxID=3128899 RepID=UPI00310192C1